MDVTQAETLIDGLAPAGSYAIEIFMDYDTGMEYRLLIGAVELDGLWEREFDAIGNPVEVPISSAHFPTPDAIYQYIDDQGLQPIGFIVEDYDHNHSDPDTGGDHNYSDSGDYNGTDPGDPVDTQGLPVFALDVTQAETLIDGLAPAGSYAIEIFMDYDTGMEYRLLIGAVELDGLWEREFDAIGNPVEVPISSAHFPTPDAIYQYIDDQGLQPIGFIVEDYDHNHSDPGTGEDHNYSEEIEFPLVGTLLETSFEGSDVILKGNLLSGVSFPDVIFGFQISESIFFDNADEIFVEANFTEDKPFEAKYDYSHLEGNRFYYRAFARTSANESFGSKKRAVIPETETISENILFPHALVLEGGWKENWLGVFKEYPSGWIYHLDFGWCYTSSDNNGGIWLWTHSNGWVWTNEQTWPYLFKNETSSWLYLLYRESGPAVMFDHLHGYFMPLHY